MAKEKEALPRKFRESSIKNCDKAAILHKESGAWKTISYSVLAGYVDSLSAFLIEHGVGKGAKIAVMLENRPEWSVIFFATLSAGAISIPISFDASSEEVRNILKDAGSEILFTAKTGRFPQDDFAKTVIDVDEDEFKNIVRTPSISPAGYQSQDPDSLACILYTSGSTDKPKGVMLTHANLLSNCNSLNSMKIVFSNDSIISMLPLHHIYPLTITMILPVIYGSTIIYPGSLRPEDISQAMTDLNPTVFVAVPQILYSFHEKIMESLKRIPFFIRYFLNAAAESLYALRRRTGVNMSKYLFRAIHRKFGKSMRLFVSGGAKLDEAVERDLFKLGFTIVEGYGLTETSPVLSINPVAAPKIGSVGYAIPGVELKIAGRNDKGIGEVIARGPNIMNGYYKREDLTAEAIKDGWFYTGDLGYFDEDGYLFLTGRSKEVIVLSSGLNINPEEVEKAYMAAAPVSQMCVLEVPAKKHGGETLVLWAVVRPDLDYFKKYGEINLRDVIGERFANISPTLPSHKRLMGFYITLEELPHTALGKIKRYEVKKIYLPRIAAEKHGVAPEGRSDETGMMNSESAMKIISCLKRISGVKRHIFASDSLELDLGIDSLGRIELASCLEAEFGIKIKDEVIGLSFVVNDLIAGINGVIAEAAGYRAASAEKEIITTEYWKKLFEALPKKENIEKIDLRPGLITWLACAIFASCVYMIFKIFCRLRVEGRENIPPKGPYILYVNHTSYLDGLLVAVAMPRFLRLDLFFVGFRPYFDVPIIKNLIKVGRIIPLDFSAHLLEALRSSFYVLKNKKNLCLFPEGIRSLDGKVKSFKNGFGILAKESNTALVPVLIEGAYEAWPRTAKYPRPHPIKVRFGKPLDALELQKQGLGMGAKDSYAAICIAAREHLTTMPREKSQ